MKITILQGLPGSGKSTFAKKFCEENTDWVRVNRDDLRTMRGKYWISGDERMITEWEQSLISIAINHNKNIMIDATNFNKRFTNDLRDVIIKAWNNKRLDEIWKCIKRFKFLDIYVILFQYLEFEYKLFNTPLEVCIERDKNREKPVGEKVIRDFSKKYLEKQ